MTERPIIFSGPMVKAILDGRKTQTRRVIVGLSRFRLADRLGNVANRWFLNGVAIHRPPLCRFGKPGDRLWVRENWRAHKSLDHVAPCQMHDRLLVEYQAGGSAGISMPGKWRPSIHLPRKFARLILAVTDVRVERLRDITDLDARAEGMPEPTEPAGIADWRPTGWFRTEWDSINHKQHHRWDDNPWVWVIGFKRVVRSDFSGEP